MESKTEEQLVSKPQDPSVQMTPSTSRRPSLSTSVSCVRFHTGPDDRAVDPPHSSPQPEWHHGQDGHAREMSPIPPREHIQQRVHQLKEYSSSKAMEKLAATPAVAAPVPPAAALLSPTSKVKPLPEESLATAPPKVLDKYAAVLKVADLVNGLSESVV